jgi:hypothetical protein
MKKSELFQNIDTLMTEVLDLKKSWDEKMEKAEDEEDKPSDAADDAVHMADHGADEETLEDYAKKLSDEELHDLISSLVQEAEGRSGGEGEGEESEMDDSEEQPGMEKAEDQMPEMDDSSVELPEQDADAEQPEQEGGDLASKISELSDEEIQTLQAAIQSELGNRSGGGGMSGGGMAQKSMDVASSADESMMKSLKAALKKIDTLSAQIESLKKSQSKKVERKESMPTQKYADPKITVLEKSSSDDSKVVMTGATLANWLISEQASGNKKVNSDLVTKANLAKSVEDASEFYKELERIGIKAPRS